MNPFYYILDSWSTPHFQSWMCCDSWHPPLLMTLSILHSAVAFNASTQCCSMLIVFWSCQVFCEHICFITYCRHDTIPASFLSCRKFCFTFMWCVLLPTLQLWPISSALALSMLANIGNLTFSPCDYSMFSQTMHLAHPQLLHSAPLWYSTCTPFRYTTLSVMLLLVVGHFA